MAQSDIKKKGMVLKSSEKERRKKQVVGAL